MLLHGLPNPLPEIPGYRILRRIGSGGMAQIYLAERLSDPLKVAIKVLELNDDELSEAVLRFAEEYRLLERLHHPHVLKVYGQGNAGNSLFIVMEYFDGGDLAQRIPPHGMEFGAAWRVLHEMAQALVEVHRLGIIHRDIKPENIMLRADGNAVLTDFGIAKQLDAMHALTAVGFVLGTPYFMSPEQIMGNPLDGRTDVYSIGAAFFNMLSGHEPYRGQGVDAIAEQHLHAPVPLLAEPYRHLQPLLEKMMAKQAQSRYTAQALLQALENEDRNLKYARGSS